MKREFENVEISCWETKDAKLADCRRSLHLWGKESARPIIVDAIDELLSAEMPARRSLSLVPPIDWPRLCTRLRLLLVPESEDLKFMHLRREGGTATLEFTLTALQEFRNAVMTWIDGGEDFRVGPANRKSHGFRPGKYDLASADIWFWTKYIGP